MSRRGTPRTLYLGRSGQLVVMAEFLLRGYNGAIPEVDRGDDIFVVQDTNGSLSRIQVKTSRGSKKLRGGYRAEFSVRLSHLLVAHTPALHYVLVVRLDDSWADFIIMSEKTLLTEHSHGAGRVVGDNVIFTVRTDNHSRILCGSQNWAVYRDNWAHWPQIPH